MSICALWFCALTVLGGFGAPLHSAPGDTVATPLGIQLDSALRVQAQRGFSGVVRIERGGTLLLRKGYGLANRERRIPFSDGTVEPTRSCRSRSVVGSRRDSRG